MDNEKLKKIISEKFEDARTNPISLALGQAYITGLYTGFLWCTDDESVEKHLNLELEKYRLEKAKDDCIKGEK